MIRRLLSFITPLVVSMVAMSLAQAAVYKWVDENGVTHYSDQPNPGAQKVTVAPAQTYAAPKAPAPTTRPATPAASAATESPAYRVCAITRPGNDEIYLNPPEVVASVKLDPPLHEGHKLVLSLDGAALPGGPAGGAGNWTIKPVPRGTHQLTLQVTGADGRSVCQAMSTFHVRQPSVLAPSNPNNPQRPRP